MSTVQRKRGLFAAQVKANAPICRDHFRLMLSVRDFPPSAPGQFVQLGCEPPADPDEPDAHDWIAENDPGVRTRSLVAPTPLLRRPFSLASARPGDAGATDLEIIGRQVGLGTHRLAELRPGESIDLIGPLGNGFPLPTAGQTALLIGGGVGIPPMIYLAEAIARAGEADAVAVVGALSGDLLPLTVSAAPDATGQPTRCVAEFDRLGFATAVATDDGSLGLGGFVTHALERVLAGQGGGAERLVAYVCGPERMMKAVAEMLLPMSIRTWVCMERTMACGIGTCQSCVCRVQPPGSAEWRYRLVCTDGPVFDARDVLWD